MTTLTICELAHETTSTHQDGEELRDHSDSDAGSVNAADAGMSNQQFYAAALEQWVRDFCESTEEISKRHREAYLKNRRWLDGPPGLSQQLLRRPLELTPESAFRAGLQDLGIPFADTSSRSERINQWLADSADIGIADDVIDEAASHSDGRTRSRWSIGRQILNRVRPKRRGPPSSRSTQVNT